MSDSKYDVDPFLAKSRKKIREPHFILFEYFIIGYSISFFIGMWLCHLEHIQDHVGFQRGGIELIVLFMPPVMIYFICGFSTVALICKWHNLSSKYDVVFNRQIIEDFFDGIWTVNKVYASGGEDIPMSVGQAIMIQTMFMFVLLAIFILKLFLNSDTIVSIGWHWGIVVSLIIYLIVSIYYLTLVNNKMKRFLGYLE